MSRSARRLLVMGLLAAGAVLRPEVATAGPAGPCPLDVCIHVERHQPGTPGGPSGGGGGGSGSSGQPPACVWVETNSVSFPSSGDGVPYDLPMDPGPSPSPDSVLLWERCNGTFTGRLAWSTPGAPAAPPLPDPATLAVDLRAGIERDLPDPEVASDPGAGVQSIVNSPVFVQVANWQARVDQTQCDPTGALCVTVHAVPAMTWSPGEPGAGTIACTGAGSRYDPAGPPPESQAAAGACAHAFTHRTGVAGRPEAWPGQVTITWTITWDSGARNGTLPDVVKTAPVPRPVGEVQAVVTGTH